MEAHIFLVNLAQETTSKGTEASSHSPQSTRPPLTRARSRHTTIARVRQRLCKAVTRPPPRHGDLDATRPRRPPGTSSNATGPPPAAGQHYQALDALAALHASYSGAACPGYSLVRHSVHPIYLLVFSLFIALYGINQSLWQFFHLEIFLHRCEPSCSNSLPY
jgi:hypothetical protein